MRNNTGSPTAEKVTPASESAAPKKLKLREQYALKDAADRPGGWGLFKRSTTEKLAKLGYFERAQHPSYGEQWRITDAGREALTRKD